MEIRKETEADWRKAGAVIRNDPSKTHYRYRLFIHITSTILTWIEKIIDIVYGIICRESLGNLPVSPLYYIRVRAQDSSMTTVATSSAASFSVNCHGEIWKQKTFFICDYLQYAHGKFENNSTTRKKICLICIPIFYLFNSHLFVNLQIISVPLSPDNVRVERVSAETVRVSWYGNLSYITYITLTRTKKSIMLAEYSKKKNSIYYTFILILGAGPAGCNIIDIDYNT